jgi:hypothetical protein
MRTANLVGVVDCSVQVSRLDVFAEGDPAVIMQAVVPKL